MKLYVTDDEGTIVQLIRSSWTPVHPEGVTVIQLGMGSVFDEPPVTHLFLDHSIRKLRSSAGLPTLVGMCKPGALVGVADTDPESLQAVHDRAAHLGIDLLGGLERLRNGLPALERRAPTPASVRELLELSGVQDVRRVARDDKEFTDEFPETSVSPWEQFYMGRTAG